MKRTPGYPINWEGVGGKSVWAWGIFSFTLPGEVGQ